MKIDDALSAHPAATPPTETPPAENPSTENPPEANVPTSNSTGTKSVVISLPTLVGPLLALDFHDAEGRVYGFPYAHLLNYQLETNPDRELNPAVPPDKLSISFSTHEVTLLGWRLDKVLDPLRLGRIESIITRSPRYANMDKKEAFVVQISVELVQTF